MKHLPTPLAILILIVWGCALTLGVGLYAVTAEPQRLITLVAQQTHFREHGFSLSVGNLSPLFWPTPGLRLDNLLLRSASGDSLHVQTVSVHLSWTRLLTGRFVPGSIMLDTPSFTAQRTSPGASVSPDAASAETVQETMRRTLHEALTELEGWDMGGLTLRLRHGQFQLFAEQTERNEAATPAPFLSLSGVEGVIRLPGLLNGLLDLRVAETVVQTGLPLLPAPLRLRDIQFDIDEVRSHVLETDNGPRRYLAGRLEIAAMPDWPDRATDLEWRVQLALRPSPRRQEQPVLDGSLEVRGNLLMAEQTIPTSCIVPFVRQPEGLAITNARATFEQDTATFNGQLTLDETGRPALSGRAHVEHLSLSRWFGFARDLPPGLQHALNRITGFLDVHLTPERLEVPQLAASTMGITFLGKGGVPQFAAPSIVLEAAAPEADLNLIFPGLLGKDPAPPDYTGPVLLPSDPRAEHGVRFDIRLRADKALFWKWQMGNLAMTITPQGRGARLALRSPAFYGGSFQTAFGFEDEVTISLLTENTNLDQLVPLMAGYPAVGGRATIRSTLRSRKDGLDALLASLAGQIQAQVLNGYLAPAPGSGGQRLPFSQLDVSFNGQGAPLPKDGQLGPLHTYTGDWRLALVSSDIKGELTFKGPLRFSTINWMPVEARQLPTNASFTAFGADVSGTGQLGFHTRKYTLAVDQFSGSLLGGKATGSLKGSELTTSPRWDMQGQCTLPGLRAFLTGRGVDLADLPPQALRTVSLAGNATWSDAHVKLSPFSGQVDATTFSGLVQKDGGTVPHWSAHLRLGKLNINDYLAKTRTKGSRATPLPVEWLRTFTLDGQVQLEALTIAGLQHENVQIPLKVSAGVMSLDPVRATLAGGKTTASLRAEPGPAGAMTSLHYEAAQVDMLTLTRARKQDSLVAGTATWNFDARGALRTTADLPSALSGQWKWNAVNGYFVEAKKLQDRDARRSFTQFSASGNLDSGVLRNDNLFITGPILKARGQGNVNLNNWTLDYRINASLPGVPDIPIHFYGSLDDPQSNVNALKVIGSALENLGRNAFDVIGDIITAPVKLFR